MGKIALMLLCAMVTPSATLGIVSTSNTITNTKVESKVDKEVSKPSDLEKDTLAPVEIEGKITEVTESKGGIMALVEGKGVNSEVKLVIDNKTEVVNEKGEKLATKDLKEGIKVKAYYGPAVTFSLPPMSVAQKIVVMEKKELFPIQGSILDIRANKESHMIHIKGKKSNQTGLNEIILNINKDTKIVNVEGEKLSINDLKEGTEVRAYYGPMLTRSLPAIGTAKKVVVFEK